MSEDASQDSIGRELKWLVETAVNLMESGGVHTVPAGERFEFEDGTDVSIPYERMCKVLETLSSEEDMDDDGNLDFRVELEPFSGYLAMTIELANLDTQLVLRDVRLEE